MPTRIKWARMLRISVLVILTIAISVDQFSYGMNDFLGGRWLTVALLCCFLFAVTAELLLSKEEKKKYALPIIENDLFLILYVIGLIALFTALGGRSQVGLTLTHPVIWVFVIYAMLKWRVDKKQEKNEAS
ncbi:hypothetical protein [Halalkalibacterium ligniniphilum]|uniref:hypothetical protein n=1 Tax=Halalkalibacterium ligniniphilum TaxID=1134413 RepID=UPI000360255D|nr:hypothetical protein [Halalkalibacterium ligniniphilum]